MIAIIVMEVNMKALVIAGGLPQIELLKQLKSTKKTVLWLKQLQGLKRTARMQEKPDVQKKRKVIKRVKKRFRYEKVWINWSKTGS